ncbi:MAG: hypothetical protein CMO16_04275 [Thaumarchaeota archaeon]|nr:hypothetical protein [Nitrososphaerota archaeon]
MPSKPEVEGSKPSGPAVITLSTQLDFSVFLNQNVETSLSWIFKRPDEFSIEIFVLMILDNQIVFSIVKKTNIFLIN